jgi:hypothetical protein
VAAPLPTAPTCRATGPSTGAIRRDQIAGCSDSCEPRGPQIGQESGRSGHKRDGAPGRRLDHISAPVSAIVHAGLAGRSTARLADFRPIVCISPSPWIDEMAGPLSVGKTRPQDPAETRIYLGLDRLVPICKISAIGPGGPAVGGLRVGGAAAQAFLDHG